VERWLDVLWQIVRGALPPPPAHVVELGCGPAGGVVPLLRAEGYDAIGVDPRAPDEPFYLRVAFEDAELRPDLDAVVASASLHHVAAPADVVHRVASVLAPAGTLVVVEWDWGAFDEPTAEWCFERLDPQGEPTWLHRRRDAWLADGRPWSDYFPAWALGEGLHDANDLVRLLDERFERVRVAPGAYFFPALFRTTEQDELSAIREGRIRAARVDYVARPRT
jgi:SAM-dependent methyltransferase